MTPAELADELDRCAAGNRQIGSHAPMFTIHPDQMPLLAAALRLAEAFSGSGLASEVHEGRCQECNRIRAALAQYRAVRERAGG